MLDVTGVSFRQAGKVYYFDSNNLKYKLGDHVIVETARGIEYGVVVKENFEINEKELSSDLKPIIRLADSADDYIYMENKKKAKESIEVCKEKVKEFGLDMKLVDCEYTFDINKVIFYFTSDERVDFRELVKELARIFRIRIELRQIGVRDQAKIAGGIGPCGQRCCCNRYMRNFNPVSIKMAKDQSLSLNPSKISGLCGRLMCCLNYEQEGYECKLKKMPHVGQKVTTEMGEGVVTETNTLLESVKVKVMTEDETEELIQVNVDELIDFNKCGGCNHKCH
ncbi:MAG: stage 0 sporulation family protein [Finegoldia magna]|uniref:PSP1 domain-containing protein n=1 Tax=Finegoldia magna TaxID=1260 RepID=UPI0026ECC357|nr:stage 0 sporulation family protein [Finegoldia magna]MBS5966279.1 stage 0 sporulation family protein [Finegoldia magna]